MGRPGAGALRFQDPEGLEHDLVVDASGDDPLIADHPQVPAEHALRGFDGVRAYTQDAELSRPLLEQALAFEPAGRRLGDPRLARGSTYAYDPPPDAAGIQGAGTIHHVAWASPMDDQEAWRERSCARAGARHR